MSAQQLTVQSPVVELERLKPLWRIYAGMLFQRDVGHDPGQSIPHVVYRQRNLHASPAAVAAYRQLCGEGPPDVMPPIYPHLMATPLQLNLLASDDFPLALAGLVHLGQSIEWWQPLRVDDVVDIDCAVSGPVQSEHGWLFRLDTNVRRAGLCVWREEVSFLKPDPVRRARPRRLAREGDASRFVPLLHLQFPDDIGRRYAQLSGDWNPIHLWPFTARRFGFKRPIAHGMFSLARCLSILEARGVNLVGKRLEASFRAPVLLPAFTNFSLSEHTPDERFALTDAGKGRILVEGRLSNLS